jgi:hypothetical protein
MRAERIWAALAVAGIGLGGALVVAAPAHADDYMTTTTEFVTTSIEPVAFGEQWLAESKVVLNGSGAPAGPTDGTIDFYLTGIGGAFASAVPIQPGGVAYLSQPDAQPMLAAGVYDITAVFTPALGTGYSSSQTTTPLTLTIQPLEVVPAARVLEPEVGAEGASVELSLGGSYTELKQNSPAGVWDVQVLSPKGEPVFGSRVEQPAALEPLTVPVDAELKSGTQYSVSVVFTADPALAGGVTVTPVPELAFETVPAGPLDWALAPVAAPLPAMIAVGAVLLALLAAAVVLAVRRAPRRADDPEVTPADAEVSTPQR